MLCVGESGCRRAVVTTHSKFNGAPMGVYADGGLELEIRGMFVLGPSCPPRLLFEVEMGPTDAENLEESENPPHKYQKSVKTSKNWFPKF